MWSEFFFIVHLWLEFFFIVHLRKGLILISEGFEKWKKMKLSSNFFLRNDPPLTKPFGAHYSYNAAHWPNKLWTLVESGSQTNYTFMRIPETFNGFLFKGTVSVISNDPPCKDGNTQFTTVPLKPLSDKKCGRYFRFSKFKSV